MDSLDPARTALLVVHMVKGVAGEVDTPFNRLFRQRAEKTGIIGVQARLLDGFRAAKAKVVYTAVTYQPGLPGVRPNSPLFRTLVDVPLLWRALPPSRSSTTSPPGLMNRWSGDRRPSGFDGTALDTILRVAGVDTLVLSGIATDVAVESTARAATDRQYRTIVVSDACQADSDEAHARALDVLQKWFSETATADEVLNALRRAAADPAHRAA